MATTGQGFTQTFKTAIDSNSSTALEEIGAVRIENDGTYGKKYYMYVKASTAVAKGDVLVPTTTTGYGYIVGTDTLNVPGRKMPVGVGIGTITILYYGWVQLRGHHTAVKKDVKTCVTQHMANMVYLCGKLRGRRANYDAATTTNVLRPVNFVPFTTKASACTTVSGYLNLW
jgi:hypothetical protein